MIMKEKFLTSSMNFLKKHNNYSEKEIQKLRYGLEGLYLTITKMIIIFLVAIILGILKETLILLVFFNIIRYFGFGFHAEKSWQCLLLSLLNFIAIPFLFLHIKISIIVKLIICGCVLINILLFAPADTIKRPLKDKKKRLIRKILTFIFGVIYTVLIYIFSKHYISILIMCSLIVMTININPLTYIIFGQPFNNYKKLN